ncbi:MAG: hypothetical protein JOS17DRAFT_743643, partial [Linnemannia elongata]
MSCPGLLCADLLFPLCISPVIALLPFFFLSHPPLASHLSISFLWRQENSLLPFKFKLKQQKNDDVVEYRFPHTNLSHRHSSNNKQQSTLFRNQPKKGKKGDLAL